MSLKKIEGYDSPGGYEDKYVSRGNMAFSFLSEDGKLVGPLVDCRGYILERLQGFLLGDTSPGSSEYKYQPDDMEDISLEKTRLVVSKKGTTVEALESEMRLVMDLLHQMEKDLHLIKSRYERVLGVDKNYGVTFLIEGSKRWMLSPVMLSLYMLAIRNGYLHKIGQPYLTTFEKAGNLVDGAAKSVERGIKHIIKYNYWKVFGKDIKLNYTKEQVAYIHGMGIQVFSTENVETIKMYMKYWQHWIWPNQAPKKAVKAA